MSNHKIQIKTKNQTVLYELESSEMFPDYSSVLKEAITFNINLKGLCVVAENIDGVIWKETDLSNVSFYNCSMKNNVFYKCKGNVWITDCDLTNAKIKESDFTDIHIENTLMKKMSIRNSTISNPMLMSCNLEKTIFWKVIMPNAAFWDCNLSHVNFYECVIDFSQISNKNNHDNWYQDLTFLGGDISGSNFTTIKDLKQLLLWNIDLDNIEFFGNEEFTIVENKNSKVIYALNNDVVWWIPYPKDKNPSMIPFRHSLKEFYNEIQQEFPNTELYPSMEDFVVKDELITVCEYLKARSKYQ
ncbi:pentapeptide repeat-containing protein [Wenyingzhuangia marina]|uniref:Pentapeptide repeat-containing protein n=1 Tax=Wenyingzhuangia marina TaxID=1195760 RepID=A0A1M5VCT1_9FLAO|nr:pentapeptide repeat-containing protein [Wenyingzhuangia marina]GGF72955.1 hypothetical protein GCM10011397_14850 [Wenyingzhuangia marina]SHH73025.1 Pentapeptide repeat-containing protein [Wenyingzhuangia marina]